MREFLAVSLALLLCASVGCSHSATPLRSGEDFVRPEENPEFRRSHALVVTVRRSGTEVRERQVTISFKDNYDRGSVVVMSPKGIPQIVYEEVPSLSSLVSQLRELKIGAVPTADFRIHQERYEMWITTPADEVVVKTGISPSGDVSEAGSMAEAVSWMRQLLAEVPET